MQINPNFRQIGEDFAQRYYQTFQQAIGQMGSFYMPEAMMTYEGDQLQGRDAIQAKYTKITGAIAYTLHSCDCQPTPTGGVLINVQGDFGIDGGHPMRFSQTFNLMQNATGGMSVINDLFRFCFA